MSHRNEACKCSGRCQDRQQVGGQFLEEFGGGDGGDGGDEGENECCWPLTDFGGLRY